MSAARRKQAMLDIASGDAGIVIGTHALLEDKVTFADLALVVVDDVCRGIAGAGRPDLPTPGRRFGWLSAPRSTVLRPSAVHSGLTLDPAAEIDTLLDRLVR